MPHPVTCGACHATFSIPDDIWERRVHGRAATLKCRSCKAEIHIDDTASGAPAPAPEPFAATKPTAMAAGTPAVAQPGAAVLEQGWSLAPPAVEELWAVSFSDDDDRELTEQQVALELARRAIGPDTIAWREGMADWLPISAIPTLAKHLPKAPITTTRRSSGGGVTSAAIMSAARAATQAPGESTTTTLPGAGHVAGGASDQDAAAAKDATSAKSSAKTTDSAVKPAAAKTANATDTGATQPRTSTVGTAAKSGSAVGLQPKSTTATKPTAPEPAQPSSPTAAAQKPPSPSRASIAGDKPPAPTRSRPEAPKPALPASAAPSTSAALVGRKPPTLPVRTDSVSKPELNPVDLSAADSALEPPDSSSLDMTPTLPWESTARAEIVSSLQQIGQSSAASSGDALTSFPIGGSATTTPEIQSSLDPPSAPLSAASSAPLAARPPAAAPRLQAPAKPVMMAPSDDSMLVTDEDFLAVQRRFPVWAKPAAIGGGVVFAALIAFLALRKEEPPPQPSARRPERPIVIASAAPRPAVALPPLPTSTGKVQLSDDAFAATFASAAGQKAGTGGFDPEAAKRTLAPLNEKLRACRKRPDPPGMARITLSFAPSGHVLSTTVAQPFSTTATGRCIVETFSGASIPRYAGGPARLNLTLALK